MYDKMMQFVEETLENMTSEVIFRKRIDHIRRVFIWANRIMIDDVKINKEAVLVAAIFHDVGYIMSKLNHAKSSAMICEKYLNDNGFESEFIDFVIFLVSNHSNKELMSLSDTPIELVLLLEADLLDETGTLSILWVSMIEGAKETQSFENTYQHILNYSYQSLKINPMVTNKAIEFWRNKQNLMNEFIKQLSFDLGIDDASIE